MIGSSRAYVIARYALASTLRSRLFVAFLVACLVPSLVLLVVVYLRYNIATMEQVGTAVGAVVDLDVWLFETALGIAQAVTFLVVLVVGPGLVAPDLANHAMPLYLSRPVPKLDYVLGKLLVLLGLAAAVGLLPGLVLIAVDAIYAGDSWASGVRWAAGFAAAMVVWTLCLSLLALAISAWVKWRAAATLGMLGLYVVASAVGDALEPVFGGASGDLLDLAEAVQGIAAALSGRGEPAVPAALAWIATTGIAALASVALLTRIRV